MLHFELSTSQIFLKQLYLLGMYAYLAIRRLLYVLQLLKD